MKYALIVACVIVAGLTHAQEEEKKSWNLTLEATPQLNVTRISGRSLTQYTVDELQQRVDDPAEINSLLLDPDARPGITGDQYFPFGTRLTLYAERPGTDDKVTHGFTAGLQFYLDNQIGAGAVVDREFQGDTVEREFYHYTDRTDMLEAVAGYRANYQVGLKWQFSIGGAIRGGRSLQSRLVEQRSISLDDTSRTQFPSTSELPLPTRSKRTIKAQSVYTYGAEASLAASYAISDTWAARMEYNRAWLRRRVTDGFTNNVNHWTFGLGVAMKI